MTISVVREECDASSWSYVASMNVMPWSQWFCVFRGDFARMFAVAISAGVLVFRDVGDCNACGGW
jgi:hypothetical protein